MTCHRYDDCWFVSAYQKSKPLIKESVNQISFVYNNYCKSENQDGCTLSKLSDIEYKVIEREMRDKYTNRSKND